MGEIVRLQTNVPVEVQLAYTEGKEVQSRIDGAPNQLMFSLANPPDGRVFLPLFVGERFRELGIRKDDWVRLLKAEVRNGQFRGIEYQVSRVAPDPRIQDAVGNPLPPANGAGKPAAAAPPAPAPPQAATPGGAGRPDSRSSSQGTPPDGTTTAAPPAVPPKGPTVGHATLNGIPYWDPKTELLRCYDEGVDVLVAAREHAAAKGLPVQFTGEDLRMVAATLYIDAGKDRRTSTINGGLR